MALTFLPPEDVEKARNKILELLELLPTPEQFEIEILMLGMELRDSYYELMKRNDGSDTQMQSQVTRLEKKKQGLNDMIDLNNKLKELKKNLSPEDYAKVVLQGAALKNKNRTNAKKQLDELLAVPTTTPDIDSNAG